MTDQNLRSPAKESGNDDVGRLIRYAGAREDVPTGRAAKAHARVLEHWQRKTAGREQARRYRRVTWYAAAASVAVAVISATWLLFPVLKPAAAPFATVASVSGDVFLGDLPLAVGTRIDDAALVHTMSGGHVVLALENGHEVRLDENTRMVARAFDRFSLERGAVFVRSEEGSSASVFVETPFGTATDLGTQFVVRLARRSIFVGVREGLVQLEKSRTDKVNVEDGSLYMLSEDGLSQFRQVGADDEFWNWVDETTTSVEIEGATLASYLEWYANEIGASIEWADDESRQRAAEIVLSGNIHGASLKEGLDEVRKIAPFDFEMTNATLRVKVY